MAIKILLLVIYKFGVRKYGAKNQKIYYVYRFACECYNGVTLDGKVIDHINDDRVDNRLCNLQLVTQQENSKNRLKIVTIHLRLKIMLIGKV